MQGPSLTPSLSAALPSHPHTDGDGWRRTCFPGVMQSTVVCITQQTHLQHYHELDGYFCSAHKDVSIYSFYYSGFSTFYVVVLYLHRFPSLLTIIFRAYFSTLTRLILRFVVLFLADPLLACKCVQFTGCVCLICVVWSTRGFMEHAL